MSDDSQKTDLFIGISLNDFVVKSKCGQGGVGSVYFAERETDIPARRAIKFIEKNKLKEGWQNEINKVNRLENTEGVVQYLGEHGDEKVDGKDYRWIAFQYVKSKSLKELIEEKRVSIPVLCDVIERVLSILHACMVEGFPHGDLHSGNVLVEDADRRNINPDQQRIWITDFCYLSASKGRDMLDDFQGLANIIHQCLTVIDFHSLDGIDRWVFSELKNKFIREVQEHNYTEGDYVRNPQKLLGLFRKHQQEIKLPEESGAKRIGDYLAAEHFGDRYDEWKTLFVPVFIGTDKLLEDNICVLTGLRGCGKTMIFRRLTALYDFHLGCTVPGTENFVGFYINARSLGEAFPWLPEEEQENARRQVIHFFHLCWLLEILEWLGCVQREINLSVDWLVRFLKQFYPEELLVTGSNGIGIWHLKSFLSKQLENARLKSRYINREWELDRLDFLELLAKEVEQHVVRTKGKFFFMFLDDYSTPLVTPTAQQILNSVVFRRSPKVIFKVATESIESIELIGLNKKLLQQEDDFVLLDYGTESIQRTGTQNKEAIIKILKPRIERDSILKEKGHNVESILGPTPYDNNELARQLRGEEGKKKVSYHGIKVFCNLWMSNTREIISLFANLVDRGRTNLQKKDWPKESPIVSDHDQDKIFRNAGSRFHGLLTSATDPTKKLYEIPPGDRSYGEHLQKIADAFREIADFELQNKTSQNVEKNPPKQARRIEIKDVSKDIPEDVLPFYRGMIRYGLFIRDWRGKSVSGRAVPRLYLRSILIPHYTLTFSKRDSVTMEWEDFCKFLRNPKDFVEDWRKNNRSEDVNPLQKRLPGM